MSGNFQWTPDVSIVPEQQEIAVYTNPNGGVVVRARGYPDDDAVIVLTTHRAARDVALAISALVSEET